MRDRGLQQLRRAPGSTHRAQHTSGTVRASSLALGHSGWPSAGQEPVAKVAGPARTAIAMRALGVRRKAMSVHIVDDEQRRARPQGPCATGPDNWQQGLTSAQPPGCRWRVRRLQRGLLYFRNGLLALYSTTPAPPP